MLCKIGRFSRTVKVDSGNFWVILLTATTVLWYLKAWFAESEIREIFPGGYYFSICLKDWGVENKKNKRNQPIGSKPTDCPLWLQTHGFSLPA
jgi:hypothetical protein